jgi:predicted RNase H-like HicB family nuclease
MAKEEAQVNGSPRIPEDYLKQPYARVLLPDEESGTYAAEILEFPGCVAQGDTPQEAYRNLEEAAKGWIRAALDLDQDIPGPSMSQGYSGRIALRLPRGLHRRAAQMAERDGTSLNTFLVEAIAERVGASDLYERMAQKVMRQSVHAPMIIVQQLGGQHAGTDESSQYATVGAPLKIPAVVWREGS